MKTKYTVKIKLILLVMLAFATLKFYFSNASALTKHDNSLKIVYITDLNLYPTPSVRNTEKSLLEKKIGLLLYESQAIFQEIIRDLNQKINPAVVVFGGDNIFVPDKYTKISEIESLWQLFFDMASEIRAHVLFLIGTHEINLLKYNEFLKLLRTYEIDSKTTWWSKTINNTLLVGLNSFYIFSNDSYMAGEQFKWLRGVLKSGNKKVVIIFLHSPVIDSSGRFITNNKNVKELLEIIRLNNNIKLVISGSKYLNRKFIYGGTVYILASSAIAYPCSFKYLEIYDSKINFKTISVPLKGVVKKAEQSIVESENTHLLFPDNVKSIKKHVLGGNADNNFEIAF